MLSLENQLKLQSFIEKKINTRHLQLYEPEVYNEVYNHTTFLDQTLYSKPISTTQRIWHVINNKFFTILCESCNNTHVGWDAKNQTYRTCCSSKCAGDLIAHANKSLETTICPICNKGTIYSYQKYACSVNCFNIYKQTCMATEEEWSNFLTEELSTITSVGALAKRYPIYNKLMFLTSHLPQSWQIQKRLKWITGEQVNTNTDRLKNLRNEVVTRAKEVYGIIDLPDYVTAATLRSYALNLKHPLCRNCDNKKTFNEKTGNYQHYCSDACAIEYAAKRKEARKPKEKRPPQNKILTELLNNKEWLVEQHHILHRTKQSLALEFGCDKETISNRFKTFGIESIKIRNKNWQEDDLFCFLQSILPDTIIERNNTSVVAPKQLDFLIPSKNLAIEYCGLYWHCDKHERITKRYHYNKMKKCETAGIRLITIFEDEWLFKKEIVKQKLKYLCNVDDRYKIHARQTRIEEVDKRTANDFFDTYHIQGTGPGQISYGLFLNDVLEACIKLIIKTDHIVINRYASKSNVRGGFSKLLTYVKTIYNKPIITFADCRWSEGNLYDQTGLTYDGFVEVDYQYFTPGKIQRMHKFAFRRKNLPTKLKTFDSTLSEVVNCRNNEYYRIWNCGLKRYVFNPQ